MVLGLAIEGRILDIAPDEQHQLLLDGAGLHIDLLLLTDVGGQLADDLT